MTTTQAEVSSGAERPGPTRGQRLWQEMMEARRNARLSLHRGRLLTASYKETEGQPAAIRRAQAFAKVVRGIPICLMDDDLLAGAYAARPMFSEQYPEFDVTWVSEALDSGGLAHIVSREDEEELRDICLYWKDRCVTSHFLSHYSDAEKQWLKDIGEDGSWVYYRVRMENDIGYFAVSYEKAIKLGLRGIIAEVERELQITVPTDDQSLAKVNMLKGMKILLEAAIEYGKRYAFLARQLADHSEGQKRDELLKLAEICEWVPGNPARNFREAVQTLCFVDVLMYLESCAQISPGRADQYLYPYYKQDIESGRTTREEAIELLECMRVKLSTQRFRHFRHTSGQETGSGDAQFHNITLGGQTPDGRDATNELSYLFLEAALRTRTPHPTLSIRWSEKSPEDFIVKGLELVRIGIGFPAFFNDRPSIAYLTQKLGVPLEIAQDYCVAGCVQHLPPTQSGPPDVAYMNFGKMLELALHDGVDPRTGNKIGPATGKFEDFRSFDDLLQAFKRQVQFFSEAAGKIRILQRLARVAAVPTLFSSSLVDDCIKRGKCVLADGPRWTFPAQTPVGIIDAADSLAAVKKCVFEDGSVGKRELLDALASNFEGYEGVRRLLSAAPKYGNDEDYVDEIAAGVYDWWQAMLRQIDGPYGAKHRPMPYSVSAHGPMGKRVGALPSARLAGVSLADGSVSPCQGSDVTGPTAVLNSAGKIDQLPLLGTLLNVKFHPSALATMDDLRKLIALIRTYFDYGGKHIQFNVVDKKTLLDAQAHPELHRDLIVRVAGYSALFAELSRSIQDEIIQRTEYAEL
ncbi:MAG: glycyl radical protein [Chloroflexi bacterium]|nr:glycyl radical protein [Chloroflexota bacterium]